MSRNITELQNVFASNPVMRFQVVRQMENLGYYEIAAKYWKILGETSHYDACMLMVEATKKGDEYRSKVEEYREYVENAVQLGVITVDEGVRQVNGKMQEIYNQVYRFSLHSKS